MKVARLLSQNPLSAHPGALSKNLGDQFLCQNNQIFANIRAATLKLGYIYSEEPNELYAALPLSQLDWMLDHKKIFYSNNVTVLRQVESKIKSGTLWDEVADNLKKNHVFHESCHAVARALNKIANKKQNEVLSILLEESFANAAELLGIIQAQDPVHRIFYEWNSYIFMNDERKNLETAVQELGTQFIFRFAILSYLHANFLLPEISEKQLQAMITLATPASAPNPKQIKALRAIIRTALKLNPRFREVTTSFYFRLRGFQKNLNELLDFDFMHILIKEKGYQDLIHQLSTEAVQGYKI